MSLTLVLNGHPRTFESLADPATLEQLISELGLKGDRIALELNGDIAPRATWPQTSIKTNDRLEVVHFVGGGSSKRLFKPDSRQGISPALSQ